MVLHPAVKTAIASIIGSQIFLFMVISIQVTTLEYGPSGVILTGIHIHPASNGPALRLEFQEVVSGLAQCGNNDVEPGVSLQTLQLDLRPRRRDVRAYTIRSTLAWHSLVRCPSIF